MKPFLALRRIDDLLEATHKHTKSLQCHIANTFAITIKQQMLRKET